MSNLKPYPLSSYIGYITIQTWKTDLPWKVATIPHGYLPSFYSPITIICPVYYYHHVQHGAYKYRGCAKSVQTSAGKVYRVYQQCTTCKHSVRYTYRPVIYCSL